MTSDQLINWLGNNINTLYPEIYEDFLPPGIKYISQNQGFNCIDFATGSKGQFWLNVDYLIKTEGNVGDLVLSQYNKKVWHAGIIIDTSQRVISQWGQEAAVFTHPYYQIPSGFQGNMFNFYEMPDASNKKAFTFNKE